MRQAFAIQPLVKQPGYDLWLHLWCPRVFYFFTLDLKLHFIQRVSQNLSGANAKLEEHLDMDVSLFLRLRVATQFFDRADDRCADFFLVCQPANFEQVCSL